MKEALSWSAIWVVLALIFNAGIWHFQGGDAGLQFLTGYLIEKSLSVDNIFVFLLIFTSFSVPAAYQHKVLFWGIIGALVMRAIFIVAGIQLLNHFHWMIYLFGAFLILTGIRLFFRSGKPQDPSKSLLVRWLKKHVPMTDAYRKDRFFIRLNGRYLATPLFLVLVLVEVTDLIFAVDSIPAILAITDDPFLVYTSNVFAILGLRSLYFALAGILNKFHYLHFGLAAILVFVGIKMSMVDFWKFPPTLALGVVALILFLSLLASWLRPARPGSASEL